MRFRINGARGWTMLCFGITSALFGLAYFGPIKITPPVPPGLAILDAGLSLDFWGAVWLVVAGSLIWGSAREDQSWPMGLFAFMLFVWSASYGAVAVTQFVGTGYTTLWFPSAMFGSILGASFGIARLVNAPTVNRKIVDELLTDGAGDDS